MPRIRITEAERAKLLAAQEAVKKTRAAHSRAVNELASIDEHLKAKRKRLRLLRQAGRDARRAAERAVMR